MRRTFFRTVYIVELLLAGPLLTVATPVSTAAPSAVSGCEAGPVHMDRELAVWVEHEPILRDLAENAAESRLQIRIYLPPSFVAPCGQLMEFRPDAEYLYPASATKIVPAIAVLSAWSLGGPGVPPLDVPLLFSERSAVDAFGNQLRVGGHAPQSLASHLEAMLVESSNHSFNALYEIAGPAALNEPFRQRGFRSIRLLHRLSGFQLPNDLAAYLPQVSWLRDGQPVVWRDARTEPPPTAVPDRLPREAIGRGYIDPNGGERIDGPMSFAQKNGISLADLQRILVALYGELPPSDHAELPPLSPEAVQLMLNLMRGPLGEREGVSAVDREARFKPMLPGILALGIGRGEVEYTNKAGRAYGFHLDNARIRIGDRVAYVAVGMHANRDGILNDDRYDYETSSFPALRALGSMVTSRLLVSSAPPLP